MAGPWWVLLLTGIAWLIISVIVLRFTTTSAATIGVLLGVVFLAAMAEELFLAYVRLRWRWAHVLMGIIFLAAARSLELADLASIPAMRSSVGRPAEDEDGGRLDGERPQPVPEHACKISCGLGEVVSPRAAPPGRAASRDPDGVAGFAGFVVLRTAPPQRRLLHQGG